MTTTIKNTNADYQKLVQYDKGITKLEAATDTLCQEIGDTSSFIYEGQAYYVSGDGLNGRNVTGGEILNDPYVCPMPHVSVLIDHQPTQDKLVEWRKSLPELSLDQKVFIKHYGFHTISDSRGRCVFTRDRDGMETSY